MSVELLRTGLLLGESNLECLHRARVAVFGVGGVGGYAVEALARGGVGALDLIDSDRVCATNINRQIIALHSTIGKLKVEAARDRCMDIAPDMTVRTYPVFYTPETAEQFDFTQYDYVIDAIDTVTGKISLILQAQEAGTPIISAMGAGNKLNPAMLEVADIYDTSICPLARVMRHELRKRGVKKLKVVYSREKPLSPPECPDFTCPYLERCGKEEHADCTRRHRVPGSTSFVPSAAGLIIASEVIKDLMEMKKDEETGS